MERISVETSHREEMVDVTGHVRRVIREQGWRDGVLTVFCPHTTCGITVNEGYDPDVAWDMTVFFRGLVPGSRTFRHAEGNSDAHIKASLTGASLQLLVEGGSLLLGTWQAVWLFEGDGPRRRELWLKWTGDRVPA